MANIHDIYGSKWLKTSDLQGKHVTLTIKSWTTHEFQQQKDGKTYPKRKIVLGFERTDKEWVVNVTCSEAIAFLYGTDPDNWIGRRIVLFPTKVPFGGGMSDAIRVKPPNEPQIAASVQPNGGPKQIGQAASRVVAREHKDFTVQQMEPVPDDDGLENEIPF